MAINNDFHNFRVITVYSSIAYLTAYLVVFLSFNVITGIVAHHYAIHTILYHYKLYFTTPDYSSLWNFDSVFYIFSSGTAFLFLFIMTLFFLFKKYEYYEGFPKIFLYWMILHSVNRIIGTFILGTIFDLYFSNVILYWYYVGDGLKLAFIIISILIMIIVGKVSTRALLLSTISFKLVERSKRVYFVWAQAFKTWFFCSIIIFLLHLPNFAYLENFLSASMFTLIFYSNFNYNKAKGIPNTKNDEEAPKYPIPWKYISIILGFMLLFRIALISGISF